ncbi:hypothetical protein HH308_19990 [Gordonia sp. TBRC 11910]|uniref:DUF6752 domain-containing protein n=1 Tax=Gordonia asplenii TaxID=2725283 RepID=A0A848KXX3_9ACTN|nr:DUF6752 domain-containing protein [Gordonia asplenii]NMO03500.1 hypothetical protein [Gordonia asplenii]
MATLKSILTSSGERFTRATDAVARLRRLPTRLRELEREVQETQRLHQRVAELTDIVAEVLVPAADRDDERLKAVLTKYNATSF